MLGKLSELLGFLKRKWLDQPLREIDVPEVFKLEAILPLGYSADDTPKKPRYSLDEVVFLNKWGNSVEVKDARMAGQYTI